MTAAVRRQVFHLWDSLRGGRIRRHLSDLEAFRSNAASADEVIADRLEQLLRHASRTTQFYRPYTATVDLSEFPVVRKGDIQGSEGRFISCEYRDESLIERRTSGSYGTPLGVYFSKEKFARHQAEVIFHNENAGLVLGDRYIDTTRRQRSWLQARVKNAVLVDPARMDHRWHENTSRTLVSNPGCFVIGFPSALFALSRYLVKSRPSRMGEIRIPGIIAIAEPLDSSLMGELEEVYQCPVHNRYATTETGVLGHSIGSDDRIRINRASYLIEVLALEGDRAAAEGEEGRVVVTDLFSHAMPLIRYETGDSAVVLSRNGRQVTCIRSPQGRVMEAIFTTTGVRLSWTTIYDIMTARPDVLQFQFRQTGQSSYHLDLVTDHGFQGSAERRLRESLLTVLGRDATLKVAYPEAIPPLPSGKRPMIMNTTNGGR